jgi:hypothetical protein
MSTSPATRSGCYAAYRTAIVAPWDHPTRIGRWIPVASMTRLMTSTAPRTE